MLYLYIELWKARPEWFVLSQQEREEFLSQAQHSIQGVTNAVGVEIVFGFNDSETFNRADYRYVAVWKMPDKGLARQLEEAVEQSGWHQYFEQVNVGGQMSAPETIFSDMIKL